MIPDLIVNKEKNSTSLGRYILQGLSIKSKDRKNAELSFEKLNLCPVMPASRRVNPLATSHTVEHSMKLSKWDYVE